MNIYIFSSHDYVFVCFVKRRFYINMECKFKYVVSVGLSCWKFPKITFL